MHGGGTDIDMEAKLKEFAAAPYVHPYNQPKYNALITHAWQFAEASSRKLFWCIAEDWPLTAEDEMMTPEELQRHREAFKPL